MPLRIHVNGSAAPPRGRLGPGPALRALLRDAVRATFESLEQPAGELSLTLLDDADITAMNERYLGHSGPTDVVSFPLHGPGEPPLGDVYVGWEQALRQAAELHVSPRHELARLAIHGTLHILGQDHPGGLGRERSAMFALQERILERVVAP